MCSTCDSQPIVTYITNHHKRLSNCPSWGQGPLSSSRSQRPNLRTENDPRSGELAERCWAYGWPFSCGWAFRPLSRTNLRPWVFEKDHPKWTSPSINPAIGHVGGFCPTCHHPVPGLLPPSAEASQHPSPEQRLGVFRPRSSGLFAKWRFTVYYIIIWLLNVVGLY